MDLKKLLAMLLSVSILSGNVSNLSVFASETLSRDSVTIKNKVSEITPFAFEDMGEGSGSFGTLVKTIKKSNQFSNGGKVIVADALTTAAAWKYSGNFYVAIAAGAISGTAALFINRNPEYLVTNFYYDSRTGIYTSVTEFYRDAHYDIPLVGASGSVVRYKIVNGNFKYIDDFSYHIN